MKRRLTAAIAGSSYASFSAVVASILFGSAIATTRFTLAETTPLALAFYRYLLASLILAPVALSQPRPKLRDFVRIAGLGLLFFGLFPVLLNIGIEETSAAEGALGIALSPVMTLVFSIALGREVWRWQNGVGVTLALFGVVLAAAWPAEVSLHAKALGYAALLGAAACVALYNVLSKPVVEQLGTTVVVAYGVMAGTLFLVPVAVATPGFAWVPQVSVGGAVGIVFLALGGTVVAMMLWTRSLSQLSPTRVSLALALNPLWAALAGALWLGESLGVRFFVGFGMVLLGVVWVTCGRFQENAA